MSFVENGGGLVAIHHTCGAYEGDPDFVSLIGGEFARHGSGWFTVKHVEGEEDRPALGGIPEFETWDETYVHKNVNDDRTDLQVRDEKGRIFYTAYGHDGRTWEKWQVQKMICRGHDLGGQAGTVWFDDISLFQLSSERVAVAKPAEVETLLARQAFEEGCDAIIRLTERVSTRSEKFTEKFMEGLEGLKNIPFTEAQTARLKELAADAAPENKMLKHNVRGNDVADADGYAMKTP